MPSDGHLWLLEYSIAKVVNTLFIFYTKEIKLITSSLKTSDSKNVQLELTFHCVSCMKKVFPIQVRQSMMDVPFKSFALSLKPLINWTKLIAIDLGGFHDGYDLQLSIGPKYSK